MDHIITLEFDVSSDALNNHPDKVIEEISKLIKERKKDYVQGFRERTKDNIGYSQD